MLTSLWHGLKLWRRLPVGPITLHLRFARTVRVRRSSAHHLNTSSAEPLPTAPPLTAPVPTGNGGLAVIVGVGPGLGEALALHLSNTGMRIVVVSRTGANQDNLVASIRQAGGKVHSYACDATHEDSVIRLIHDVRRHHGVPTLVVYSLQWFARTHSLAVTVPEIEESWRHNCLGPFLLARTAGRMMSEIGRGTIVLIGSTSSILAREEHLSFAMSKFALRALAQVLARELWPRGIHVAHLLVDADIRETNVAEYPQSDPAHIAQSIEFLHRQPRSAWTSELDIRPWNERFWDHC